MRSFLVAGFIAYINGRNNTNCLVTVIEILLLSACGYYWCSIFLMGCLVEIIEKTYLEKWNKLNDILKYIVRIILLITAFVIIKRPESTSTYYFYGVSSALFLFVVKKSEKIKFVLEAVHPIVFLGRFTMTIFLIHNAVFLLISRKLLSVFQKSDFRYAISFMIVFIISMVVIIILAIPFQKLLDKMVLLGVRNRRFVMQIDD
jgi:peptidoglycan/LPS O-acetylase OafA/YrhL